MDKIGLQMYTVRDHMKTLDDLKVTLGKLRDIGLTNIQTTAPEYITPEDYAKLLAVYGMKADSAYLGTGEINFDDSASIDAAAEKIKRQINAYGCSVVRTNSIPQELRADADGYKKYAEILNREGKMCRELGCKYIYHFHAFEFVTFGYTRGIDILLNDTDPTCVFFQPDVFWLTNAGTEPSVSLKMFAGRCFWIHVKDYAIKQLTGVVENVPFRFASVGEGNLNWQGIFKTAKEIGIERFVIEQDSCTGDVFEAVKTSFDNLCRFIELYK